MAWSGSRPIINHPDPDTVIFDGTWVVGKDVQPGTYRDGGGSSGCYWERLSGFSGEMSDVIANGFSEDVQIVTIAPSDVGFHSSGCGTWTLQNLSASESLALHT